LKKGASLKGYLGILAMRPFIYFRDHYDDMPHVFDGSQEKSSNGPSYNAFRKYSSLHISLCYSLNSKWIKNVFFLNHLYTIP
jgi:hypothetical protein